MSSQAIFIPTCWLQTEVPKKHIFLVSFTDSKCHGDLGMISKRPCSSRERICSKGREGFRDWNARRSGASKQDMEEGVVSCGCRQVAEDSKIRNGLMCSDSCSVLVQGSSGMKLASA